MSNERIVTIPAEQLLLGFPVNLEAPTYKDYVLARKLYPEETREMPQGPGYTFEEFLCALSIRDTQGKEPDSNSKDAMDRLSTISLSDKQFIIRSFISGFMLTQEMQDEAESFGDSLIEVDPNSISFTITKNQLPWHELGRSKDITFNRPNTNVQVTSLRNYTSPKVNGCMFEEVLLATCISQINGEPVKHTDNYIEVLYDLELLDVQYLSALFIKMFTLSLPKRQEASNLGKGWRHTALKLPQSSSQKDISKVKQSQATTQAQSAGVT